MTTVHTTVVKPAPPKKLADVVVKALRHGSPLKMEIQSVPEDKARKFLTCRIKSVRHVKKELHVSGVMLDAPKVVSLTIPLDGEKNVCSNVSYTL
jgi:hypothetical protein